MTIVYRGENTADVRRQANAAAASAAVALAAAGPNYASTAAGLAATTVGDTFAVDNGDDTITVYSHDAGPVATELRTFPKDILALLASTASGKGAALIDGLFSPAGAAAADETLRDVTDRIVQLDRFDGVDPTGVADSRTGILAAIEWAAGIYEFGLLTSPGVTILGSPGARYAFSGRILIKSGVTLDLGRGAAAGKLIALDTAGGIDLGGGAALVGAIRATVAGYIGPALVLDTGNPGGQAFGRNDRQTWFDVDIRANRQAGSKGLLMTSSADGLAWVRGKATIGEIDYPCDLVASGTGYVNENWLDLTLYDGVESCRLLESGGGQTNSNRIRLTTQSGIDGRSVRNLKVMGLNNIIDFVGWDWTAADLSAAATGEQILLTEESGGNLVRGIAGNGIGFDLPMVIDLAPSIRANIVEIGAGRDPTPLRRALLPLSVHYSNMGGDQDDELAWAGDGAWSAATGGATPFAGGDLVHLFRPNGIAKSVANATETTVTVDLGSARAATEFCAVGVHFSNASFKPDKCKIETSANGADWTMMVQAGYYGAGGGGVPNVLSRVDGSGLGGATFRYLRLTCENASARTLVIERFYLGAKVNKVGGAWLSRLNPKALGGIYVEGIQVVGEQQAAIADLTVTATSGSLPTADGAVTIADATAPTVVELLEYCRELEAILEGALAALRTHGLIDT